MPIELKKPISYISGLTCENCIHYQRSGEDYCCINPNSYDWDRVSGDTCSNGEWFWKIGYPDDSPGLRLFGYSTMIQLFAEEKLDV